ncbi:leucine-rich PPR motif-containing protein, mitochondrial-like isoform X2 [Biomphalaria glabrata]|nr:leucine-rich PPR motif-containing protein, mitochondrial-like isoform X2 [Biomphalaria glabrata]
MVIEMHKKIDYNIGISSNLFTTFYSSLKDFDAVTEQDIGFLLHVCSVGPFDASVKKRLALVEEIWNKMEELGLKPTTRLFNVKLRTYCGNKKLFNPLEELMNMKSLGLNPDKVTYQLLIEGFCQKGDIKGANLVLEAMKETDYYINLNIFNSFITGHLKAGSPEEAAKVLDILRSKNLSPNSETYFRYAEHYAEVGDIENVMKYVHEAEADNVPMSQTLLLNLYQVMINSGHGNNAENLLNHIMKIGLFNSATIQKSCQLISEGFNDAAFELYMKMPKAEEGRLTYHSGSFLLKTMIINDQSAEEIISMADKIQEVHPKSLAHQNSLLYSYRENKIDLALQLVELMHAKNHPIRPVYIVPAICNYRNNNNITGVYKAVKMLIDKTSGQDKEEQLLHCCYPALLALKQTKEDILSAFKGDDKLWNTVFFCSDIMNSGYTQALNNAKTKEDMLWLPSILEHALNRAKQNFLATELESSASVLSLISQLPEANKEGMRLLAGDLLFYLIMKKDWISTETFTQLLTDKNLKVNNGFQNMRSYADMPVSLKEKLIRISARRDFKVRPDQRAQDEAVIDRVMKGDLPSRQPNKTDPSLTKPNFMKLLSSLNDSFRKKDLDSLKQGHRELQANGFIMKASYFNSYLLKLVQLGDSETAFSLFQELRAKGDDGMLDKSVVLSLGAALIKTGNVEGTLNILKALSEGKFSCEEKFSNVDSVKTILIEAPSIKDAETLHEAIIKHKAVETSEVQKVHQFYVSRILMLSDDDEVVRYLMRLHEHYHVFPSGEKILKRFIEKKDVDRLKRVMDVGLHVFGNNYLHHLLAFSFLQSGLANKAAVIFQTPGLKLNERLILDKCQYYIKMRKVDWLSELVNITRTLPISRTQMLKHLAQGYIATQDLTKATSVIRTFLDDFIEPPKNLVRDIVRLYQNANQELPEILKPYEQVEKKQPRSEVNQSSTDEKTDDIKII